MYIRAHQLLKRILTIALLAVLFAAINMAQAATEISNQAAGEFSYAGSSIVNELLSNTVKASVTAPARVIVPPVISFFRDNQYQHKAIAANFGQQIFLQASANGCDASTARETATITVHAQLSGDTEVLPAYETSSTSGIFDVMSELWIRNAAEEPVVANDGIFQVEQNDRVLASINACGSGTAEVWLLIDPRGVVFDSQTNAALSGATVRLIDVTGDGNGGHPGADAMVYGDDGVTPAPSTVITDAQGGYQFPLVASSRYKLLVAPPGDYSFPSQRAAGALPNGRNIDVYGSYGGEFSVNDSTGMVVLDVPLDGNPGGIFVQKTASRPTAEVAESIEYTIVVKNVSGMTLNAFDVRDDLPLGFSYVAGTTRVDGVRAADPHGGKGPTLHFTLSVLANGDSHTLTYRALLGAGALHGDGVNRAQATSTQPAIKTSNTATAIVKVSGGVFDDKAYVLGKIYADCNANGVQDAGEAGIPGVRLYLEDGSFVISDGAGNYSFYGVTPRTHVLKVDATTLPPDFTLTAIAHRHAGDGNSVFVDVQRSELHRADFAGGNCSAALAVVIQQRKALSNAGGELALGLKTELKLDTTQTGDVRALPASGIIGDVNRQLLAATATAPALSAAPAANNELGQLIHGLDHELGFVGLHNGDVVQSNQINVRIKSWPRSRTVLLVNGVEIPAQRIGARAVAEDTHVELREYIGVALQPGDNELTISEYNELGTTRTSRQIHITAPGPLAQISVSTPTPTVDADGEVHAKVQLRLTDADGLLVSTRTAVTLETTLGEWQALDMDTREPGTQLFVEGGSAEFALRGPSTPGSAQIRVSSGELSASTNINFTPVLRPLVATGLLEGAINLHDLKFNSLQPARDSDGFEQELTQFSNSADTTAGARAALFLKGKVKGDYLLTLAVDSDKDTHERLFRDIEPDRFYPVYGDSSVKGFDAQSTGRLYVRIDKERSYFLIGDLTTQAIDQARTLGAYNRSLNGVKEHYEQGRVTVDAFASRDSTRQIVDELAANGTSGPYELRSRNALENSERVEIITRDRNQPSVIISIVPLQRFADYEIESFTGHLILHAPVPSVDANLNPVSLRITYEVEQGGDAFWVGGLDTRFKLSEQLTLGAAVMEDRNPQDSLQLTSTNATWKITTQTTLITEVARSESDSTGSGLGERFELRHAGKELQARVYGGRTDAEFNNPSASLGANRSEGGAKASYLLSERTRLVGEALHTGDVQTGAARDGALLSLEHSFENRIKLESGFRYVHDRPASSATTLTETTESSTTTTSVRTKLSAPLPYLTAATAYGEYEQDLLEAEKRVAALGGDYQLAQRTRLYARHEFISSLNGPYALDLNQKQNVTVFGVDTSYLQNDHFFSEYRVSDDLSGREAQAAIGLRNGWQLAEGLRLTTSFERVSPLGSNAASSTTTSNNDNTALAGGVEYTRNPLWKGTARLELRNSTTSKGIFSTLGFARKLTEQWSFLSKNVLAIDDSKSAQPDRLQERLQVGMAYRDSATNRIDGLARYEFKIEKNTTETGLIRRAHIVSGHINYQPWNELILTGQYAAKLAIETTQDIRISSNAQLIGGRVTRDLGKHWDIGVAARVLFSQGLSSYQHATGIEGGYLIRENLWISSGVNFTGFHDRDLSVEEYTDRGVYLRLRYKFDETLMAR